MLRKREAGLHAGNPRYGAYRDKTSRVLRTHADEARRMFALRDRCAGFDVIAQEMTEVARTDLARP